MPEVSSLPQITVRTASNRAVLITNCQGSEHKIFVYPDGRIENPYHDRQTDDIMFALGAELHACRQSERLITAAHTVVNALNGQQDAHWKLTPHGTFKNDGEYCSWLCRGGLNDNVWHFSTLQHVATEYSVNRRTLNAFIKWEAKSKNIKLLSNLQTHALDVYEYCRNNYGTICQRSERIAPGYANRPIPQLLLTKNFVNIAYSVFEKNLSFSILYRLRAGGIRVEWLDTLTRNLNFDKTQDLSKEEAYKLVNALTAARNVCATNVSEYINAGIYSNFYTYTKNNVPPEIILPFWEKNNRTTSLAELLREGHTLAHALQQDEPPPPKGGGFLKANLLGASILG